MADTFRKSINQGFVEIPQETVYPHYHKNVSHLKTIDVYRVLDLYEVGHPAIQHAIKKLLCAGGRGNKDLRQDLQEAIDSIQRALQMIDEDEAK